MYIAWSRIISSTALHFAYYTGKTQLPSESWMEQKGRNWKLGWLFVAAIRLHVHFYTDKPPSTTRGKKNRAHGGAAGTRHQG
jgi:hypothetical protein